jgi:hypothetical protein
VAKPSRSDASTGAQRYRSRLGPAASGATKKGTVGLGARGRSVTQSHNGMRFSLDPKHDAQ